MILRNSKVRKPKDPLEPQPSPGTERDQSNNAITTQGRHRPLTGHGLILADGGVLHHEPRASPSAAVDLSGTGRSRPPRLLKPREEREGASSAARLAGWRGNAWPLLGSGGEAGSRARRVGGYRRNRSLLFSWKAGCFWVEVDENKSLLCFVACSGFVVLPSRRQTHCFALPRRFCFLFLREGVFVSFIHVVWSSVFP